MMGRSFTRRRFLRLCAATGLAGASAVVAGERGEVRRRMSAPDAAGLKEALFWKPLPGGRTRCLTCPNHCERGEGGISACHTRVTRNGRLFTLTYGRPCELQPDPLAKNPLYHVDPGADALGVATAGCNLTCTYCQNWTISQVGPDRTRHFDVSPEQVVEKAKARNLRWITFSYTEPVAYLEYLLDTARVAASAGLRIAVVTAGYVCPDPLNELIRHTDAFSVTLKGATSEFYREVCGANLQDVVRSLRAITTSGKWLEVVCLVVPGLNDSDRDLRSVASTVARMNRDIPLHFLRFEPAYKLRHLPRTPLATLERARALARSEGVRYVYLDLAGHEAANTVCPRCGKTLLERAAGFSVIANRLRGGKCPQCSTRLPGLFLS